MSKPKIKPHEARDQKIIAEAVAWTAFAISGRDRRREDCGDQASALQAAQTLANQLGKPALVYAINSAGQQAYVTSIAPLYGNKPGEAAAILAAETGIDYSRALVMTNTD